MSDAIKTLPSIDRDHSLDFLRGSAVLFMIATHMLVLFSAGHDSKILEFISWWGGAVSFTIFLFVFATVLGLKISKKKLNKKNELRRSVMLLGGYFLVAIWVYFFTQVARGDFSQVWNDLIKILTLQKQPPFTEFITSFVFYIWMVVLLNNVFVFLQKKVIIFLLVIAGIFLLSSWLYTIFLPSNALNAAKAQLVGHLDRHSFGIFSYFPIFAIGIWWGDICAQFKKQRTFVAIGLLILLLCGAYVLDVAGLHNFTRWPPSVYFLLYGLVYVVIVTTIYPLLSQAITLVKSIEFIGENAFAFYLYHILLLLPLTVWLAKFDMFGVVTMLLFISVMAFISVVVLVQRNIRKDRQPT